MRPQDFQFGDPKVFSAVLKAWEQRRDELARAHATWAAELVAAQGRLAVVEGWVERLRAAVTATRAHADALGGHDAELTAIAAELADVEAQLADHEDARRIATARLLGGPATGVSPVLVPLRLETRWGEGTLDLRIYPDVLSVDQHDPSLTADEVTWGGHYWQVHSGAVTANRDETWRQLARRFGPQRAAWVVSATNPAAPAATTRPSPWPRPARGRLMPDRFAVVAYSGGEPIDVAQPGSAPRFVTWTAAVADPLECGSIDGATNGSAWLADFAAAQAAGMAVSVPVPAGAPPIELLAVVGIRSAGAADGAQLSELLRAHAFSTGVEVLADGTPTNNSGSLRAVHTPLRTEDAARALLDAVLSDPDGGDLATHAAGAQAAELLGVGSSSLAPLPGASADRAAPLHAMRLLVGLAARGPLRDELEPAAPAAWSLLEPGGPAPALRIGRQPYGILPATAPGRWTARATEAAGGLTPLLRRWAAATGPVAATDPAAPPRPVGGGNARRTTRTDDVELPVLLVEAASSVRWSPEAGAAIEGLDAIVGPAEGPQSTASVLALVASTAPADLPAAGGALPSTLLAQVAIAAKRRAQPGDVPAVNAALGTLGAVPREDLARTMTELLDAMSHRFDAWLTAAVTERLRALRREHAGEVVVGAFGWLTDLAPRTEPRSHGHLHAPSLGHAATGAVLRSAFLGQRREAWATRIDEARGQLAAAEDQFAEAQGDVAGIEPTDPAFKSLVGRRAHADAVVRQARARAEQAHAGLTTLSPLDAETEARLPMAVDLSSRRVRGARWLLSAVRAGQPLGALLGYQFERDLADAGLQQYLAAFRKLTRFRTGTALEQVEDVRRAKRTALAAAQASLGGLEAAAHALEPALGAAEAAATAAAARLATAQQSAAPYLVLRDELTALPATLARLQTELDAIDAPPVAREDHYTIQVP